MKRFALTLVLGHIGWFAVLALPSKMPIELRLAPFAAGLALVCMLVTPGLKARFRITKNDVLVGVLVGLLLALATHVGAGLVFSWFPETEEAVRSLYGQASADDGMSPLLLIMLVVVIVAEEVIWRGSVLMWFSERTGWATAVGLTTVAYAASAMGLGSFMLGAAALGMGTVWTLLAAKSQRISSALISHLVWSAIILVLIPL